MSGVDVVASVSGIVIVMAVTTGIVVVLSVLGRLLRVLHVDRVRLDRPVLREDPDLTGRSSLFAPTTHAIHHPWRKLSG
jgi:hypothetical protein